MPKLSIKYHVSRIKGKLTALRSTLYANKGFTLIEILVAISIVSLIAVIGVPNLKRFNEGQQFQNDVSELIRNLRRMQSNSQSSIVCSPTVGSSSWTLSFKSESSYSYIPTCSGATPVDSTVPISSSTKIISIKSSSGSNCDLKDTTVSFVNKDKSIVVSCKSGSLVTSVDKIIVYLQNQKDTSEYAGIVINNAGMVSQCELDPAASSPPTCK